MTQEKRQVGVLNRQSPATMNLGPTSSMPDFLAETRMATDIRRNARLGLVLSRLRGVRPTGDGWMAECPAHDDPTPSLSVALGRDGRVLLHCFAACSIDAVLSGLNLTFRDLFLDTPIHRRAEVATRPLTDPTLALAMRQRKRLAPYLPLYRAADHIRILRSNASVMGAVAMRVGASDFAWELADLAAFAIRESYRVEAALDDILNGGRLPTDIEVVDLIAEELPGATDSRVYRPGHRATSTVKIIVA